MEGKSELGMSRRRLRVRYSSSDDEDDHHPPPPLPQQQPQFVQIEEEEDEIEVDFESVTLNSPNPNPNPYPNPIQIDPSDHDEEFVEVSDNLSPPSMMDPSSTSSSAYFEASDSPIGGFLERLGLRLRRDWVDDCVRGLEGSVSGFRDLDVAAKAKLCFQHFLFSDMNYCGAGILPEHVHGLHLDDLAGPFVLQVDEIVNMSCPLKGRYEAANPGLKRCLKLSMTDGVQRVFGMEYRSTKDLHVLSPAGLKIVIRNVQVRRGILMLVPEVVEVLGGLVEDLEAARQRLVHEVNKPPRGKRTRNGVVPPLATRATLAAWPPNGLGGSGPTSTTTTRSAVPPQTAEPVVGSLPGASSRERTTQGFSVPNNTTNNGPNLSTPVENRRANVEPNLSSTAENSWSNLESNVSSTAGNRRTSVESNLSSTAENSRANFEPKISSTAGNNTANVETNPSSTPRNSITNIESNLLSSNGRNISMNVEPNLSSIPIPDIEDIHMADVDHPFMLSGDREFPFTYIASLSAKLAAMEGRVSYIQGTIKCFLTGVKGFQYKQRVQFELRAYVDDGSLISEILIDHNLVQKRVGHSPQQVTAALSSPDKKRVGEMKEILKQFQIFLANFEGKMVVQISEASPIPIATEMNQGSSTSDAWLLLRRLKSFNANPPQQQQPHIEPIDLSP